MPIIKCDYCNKDFNKRLDKIKISKNNFCSHECRVKGKFKNPNTICVNCGKIFKQTPYKIKRNKNNFCSKECQTIYYKNSYKTSGNITVIVGWYKNYTDAAGVYQLTLRTLDDLGKGFETYLSNINYTK